MEGVGQCLLERQGPYLGNEDTYCARGCMPISGSVVCHGFENWPSQLGLGWSDSLGQVDHYWRSLHFFDSVKIMSYWVRPVNLAESFQNFECSSA